MSSIFQSAKSWLGIGGTNRNAPVPAPPPAPVPPLARIPPLAPASPPAPVPPLAPAPPPPLIKNDSRGKAEEESVSAPKKPKVSHKLVFVEPKAATFLTELGMTKEVLNSGRFLVSILTPEEAAYQEIFTYINNSQGNYAQKGATIFSIDRVCDIIKGERRYPSPCRFMLWHGTGSANVSSILHNGFKLPDRAGFYGKGIYFADRIQKSLIYCRDGFRTGYLFLCDVFIGNAKTQLRPADFYKVSPNTCDSIKGIGRSIPNEAQQKIIGDCIWPLGKTVQNTELSTESYYHEFNEYVVYDPTHVRPQYLVKVKF